MARGDYEGPKYQGAYESLKKKLLSFDPLIGG